MVKEENKSLVSIGLDSSFELLKSFDVFEIPNTTKEQVRDIVPTISPFPDGGKFIIKRNLQLKPGDKVIVGLASTPSVDLVNDAILDIEYTFGDYIEDFLETGRIFYEHGYKLIGKTDPNDMYDVPLGVPIAVQFNKQKLYVWILLDMNHPLSKKVYSILNNKDERISHTLGLSIGAIPIGKGRTEYVNGKAVNVPPKMRLYEVSFTGQPINTETWSKIVKSLLYNSEGEDYIMNKKEKNSKLKAGEELTMEDKEQNNLDSMLDAPEGDVGGEMGAEQGMLPGSEAPQEGEQDTNVLSDLLGGDEQAEQGEEGEGESTEALSTDLVLDKLDMLSERLEKLEDMLSKVSEMEQKEAEQENPQARLMEETQSMKSMLEKVTKSLDSINDNLEIFSSVVKSLKEEIDVQKEELKSLFNQKVSEVQETVTKSLSVKETSTPVNKPVLGLGKSHPNMGNVEETNNIEFELKVKSLIADKSKLSKLKSMYDSYKKFKGSPIEIKNFEDRMYEAAKKEFNLTEVELKKIFKELRTKDK